jgi:hypothetical protein
MRLQIMSKYNISVNNAGMPLCDTCIPHLLIQTIRLLSAPARTYALSGSELERKSGNVYRKKDFNYITNILLSRHEYNSVDTERGHNCFLSRCHFSNWLCSLNASICSHAPWWGMKFFILISVAMFVARKHDWCFGYNWEFYCIIIIIIIIIQFFIIYVLSPKGSGELQSQHEYKQQ